MPFSLSRHSLQVYVLLELILCVALLFAISWRWGDNDVLYGPSI
jgi:hypothetical protein